MPPALRGVLAAVIIVSGMLSLSGCAALLLLAPSGGHATTVTGAGGTGGVVPYSDGSTNQHGYIPKTVNDAAGVIDPSGTVHDLSFTVYLIRDASDECDGTPPAGLHPLEVDIRGQLDVAAASNPEVQTVSFGAAHWSYYAPGSTTPVPVGSGDPLCWGEAPAMTFVPGQTWDIAPYLLVPDLTGSIAFTLPDGTGWEWDLPSSLS